MKRNDVREKIAQMLWNSSNEAIWGPLAERVEITQRPIYIRADAAIAIIREPLIADIDRRLHHKASYLERVRDDAFNRPERARCQGQIDELTSLRAEIVAMLGEAA